MSRCEHVHKDAPDWENAICEECYEALIVIKRERERSYIN